MSRRHPIPLARSYSDLLLKVGQTVAQAGSSTMLLAASAMLPEGEEGSTLYARVLLGVGMVSVLNHAMQPKAQVSWLGRRWTGTRVDPQATLATLKWLDEALTTYAMLLVPVLSHRIETGPIPNTVAAAVVSGVGAAMGGNAVKLVGGASLLTMLPTLAAAGWPGSLGAALLRWIRVSVVLSVLIFLSVPDDGWPNMARSLWHACAAIVLYTGGALISAIETEPPDPTAGARLMRNGLGLLGLGALGRWATQALRSRSESKLDRLIKLVDANDPKAASLSCSQALRVLDHHVKQRDGKADAAFVSKLINACPRTTEGAETDPNSEIHQLLKIAGRALADPARLPENLQVTPPRRAVLKLR
jgi:hypothetical protein